MFRAQSDKTRTMWFMEQVSNLQARCYAPRIKPVNRLVCARPFLPLSSLNLL